jgi:signal transduction histidine kinase
MKTSEIDTLISDLFSTTLDELNELKIAVKQVESTQIEKFIKTADLSSRVRLKNRVPECLIDADPMRLSQVVGNIISNAYKYADTEIEVSFEMAESTLKTTFKDFGKTLQREELFLLKNKFYRGKNADGKDGVGLGLFICQKLLESMGGTLDFLLEVDGFSVIVSMKLS